MTNKAAYEYLMDHGVKPSVQRIAIMDYLLKNRTHPTAEEIYSSLVNLIPTLSKTTVYNTLKLFVEQGAALMLTIDEKNVKFDAETNPHAHFLCRKCNRVYDLPLNLERLSYCTELPGEFEMDEMSLYVRGVCRTCHDS